MASVGTLKADVVVNSEGAVTGMRKAEQAVSGGASRIRAKLNEMASTKSIVEEQIAKGGWNTARMRPGALGGGGGAGGGGGGGGGGFNSMLGRLKEMAEPAGLGGSLGRGLGMMKAGSALGAWAAPFALGAGILGGTRWSGADASEKLGAARDAGLDADTYMKVAKLAGDDKKYMEDLATSMKRLADEGPNAASGLKALGEEVAAQSATSGDTLRARKSRGDQTGIAFDVLDWKAWARAGMDKFGDTVDASADFVRGDDIGTARAGRVAKVKADEDRKSLEAGANLTAKEVMTGQEKFNQRQADLANQLNAELITGDQYSKAVAKAKEDYLGKDTGPQFAPLTEVGTQEAYAATIAAQYGDEGVGHLRSIEQHLANIDARGQGLGSGDPGKAVDF